MRTDEGWSGTAAGICIMATPNDPNAPKKPIPPPGPAKAPPPRPTGPAPKPSAPAPKPAGATPPKPAPGVPAKPAPGAAPKPAAKPPLGKGPADKAPRKPSRDKTDKSGRRKLGQVMVDLGFIDEDQIWDILEEAKSGGQLTGQAAVARGLINEDQLLTALAEQNGLRVVNLDELKPQSEATSLVSEIMASTYKVLPISFKDKVLTIAIGDPSNLSTVDDLRNLLGITDVVATLATPKAIADATPRFYAGKEESIIDLINELETGIDPKKFGNEKSMDLGDMLEMADAAPVRKLINMVFLLGIKDKASDIHFEPFEDEYKIRMRCDGVLYEMVPPPRHLGTAISSRIKVMSNLDIAERRVPQDGRIELNVGGHRVDMRVSILPTMFGESVCIRVLDRSVINLDLNKIGMDPKMLATFRGLIAKPNGIILVTGPTGAGKTTTLYSALSELNVITDKIITTEDPVEYEIDGLIQCPINHEIGMTFAVALRSILRQDPDKILVGEIRDLETAQIAVQAALTGHIVFSTLHTNDAPSSITRMRDMGLEPFLITATVEGVLAQRLVRKICEDCRTDFTPGEEQLMELNLKPEDMKGKSIFFGRGCDRCNNTGYRSRMGIYELVVMNDDLRDLISGNTSTDQLRNSCRKSGMTTLRESGLRAMFNGHTTIDEIVRETVLDDEG